MERNGAIDNIPNSVWEISPEHMKEKRKKDEKVIAYNRVIDRAYAKYDPPRPPKPERLPEEGALEYVNRLYEWGSEYMKQVKERREQLAPLLTRIRRLAARKYGLKLVGSQYQ